jgi:hypothetical protein
VTRSKGCREAQKQRKTAKSSRKSAKTSGSLVFGQWELDVLLLRMARSEVCTGFRRCIEAAECGHGFQDLAEAGSETKTGRGATRGIAGVRSKSIAIARVLGEAVLRRSRRLEYRMSGCSGAAAAWMPRKKVPHGDGFVVSGTGVIGHQRRRNDPAHGPIDSGKLRIGCRGRNTAASSAASEMEFAWRSNRHVSGVWR